MTSMTRLSAIAAAAILFTLPGCGQKAPEIVGGAQPDAVAKEAAKRPPVVLPAAIKESRVYRCKDQSVFYANFLTDGTSANVRDKEESPPSVTLAAPAPGEPFVGVGPLGEGFKLVGSGKQVTYTSPKSGTQVCKA